MVYNETIKAYHDKYVKTHPDKIREIQKKYSLTESFKALQRIAHRERYQNDEEHRLKKQEQMRAYNKTYYARKKAEKLAAQNKPTSLVVV